MTSTSKLQTTCLKDNVNSHSCILNNPGVCCVFVREKEPFALPLAGSPWPWEEWRKPGGSLGCSLMLSSHRILPLLHLATAFAPELGLWGQPTPWPAREQITGSPRSTTNWTRRFGGGEEPAPNSPSGLVLGCCDICASEKSEATWPDKACFPSPLADRAAQSRQEEPQRETGHLPPTSLSRDSGQILLGLLSTSGSSSLSSNQLPC